MRKAATRGKLLSLTLAVLVALVVPLVAYADNKAPVSCSVTLSVTNTGTLSMKKGEVRTKGEQTTGTVDCNVDALDGTISTTHDSEVTIDAFGNIAGELKGDFSLATASGTRKGKLEASIAGVVIGFAAPGVPIHSVTDVGEWKIMGGGDGPKGDGTFTVTLVGIVGIPAAGGGLTGSGSMQGEVKVKD